MRTHRRWAGVLGCCLVLALMDGNLSSVRSQETGTSEPRPDRQVRGVVVTQDTLSVNVREEDFTAIFRDIAAQVQFDVSNLDGLPQRRISTQFTGLPVMEGVKRLLRVADVAGYVIVTAHSEDRVKIERVLFLDANVNAGTTTRVASPQQMARRRARRASARTRRARARPAASRRQENNEASTRVIEDLSASPETEQLLEQAVHPDEQVREQAIEGLLRLAGGSDRKRDLIEALGPLLDDLRHGDEEARDEAREDILSMIRR